VEYPFRRHAAGDSSELENIIEMSDENDDIARSIQAQLDRAVAALQRGDHREAVRGLFAPDAVFVSPGATLYGRDAIEALFAMRPGRFGAGSWIRGAAVTVNGEFAYEHGTNRIVTVLPDGSETASSGRYLSVWQRQADGSWLIVADAPMVDPAQ
jgi:uncharacterized protein (TIGR02246 family)